MLPPESRPALDHLFPCWRASEPPSLGSNAGDHDQEIFPQRGVWRALLRGCHNTIQAGLPRQARHFTARTDAAPEIPRRRDVLSMLVRSSRPAVSGAAPWVRRTYPWPRLPPASFLGSERVHVQQAHPRQAHRRSNGSCYRIWNIVEFQVEEDLGPTAAISARLKAFDCK